ncbi:uncharacterized protein L3040_006922 [Drepanopeziza brunnea f. sp. 'multigermtubi']|uniref:Uncharacterized protein n=1 Tax=Marssonina brunnea f. sp. multigermtubi (strain MB_m1) TaxID=1072389 RepID=K1XK17_MARBU|nr:uncharacterized protein MBM_08998 [Drepanopeziza brunnea f. sp. 'multigermtubi' MB_m1]EKD12769.1 hypothetical protein MBM_08998 [Drepanopeziza brunnea f. sp. 'multigermtubi' MB_m1]KAJ5038051.1 hypothetical protein L3040_006922 [Drepanopeziza brunnea f. sp. 'multigermtubi']
MLPPIDDSILEANPKFAALHSILAKQILNPNGSTKYHPAQKERDAVSEALKISRIRSAKAQLLKSTVQNLDLSSPAPPAPPATTTSKPSSTRLSHSQAASKPPTTSLPADLLELILLLSSHLSAPQIPPSQQKLLASTPHWASLATQLPRNVGPLLSTSLQAAALALCKILTPSTNPSFLHRSIPRLVPTITALQDEGAQKRSELAARRAALVSNTTTLLTLHHLAASLMIRILEQTAHGAVARHLKSRADFLALRAVQVACEAAEKKAKGERIVYSEEVRHALENYVRELRSGQERGRERMRMAERTLWGYGVGREEGEDGGEKERVLKALARAYGELVRELEEVGRDVERLRGK